MVTKKEVTSGYKTVYGFNEDGYILDIQVIDAATELTDFQTEVVPPENTSVKFDTQKQEWIEFTPKVEISLEMQAINALGLQMAQMMSGGM